MAKKYIIGQLYRVNDLWYVWDGTYLIPVDPSKKDER